MFGFALAAAALLSSCYSPWSLLFPDDDDDREIEYTTKFSLAIGGVMPGRDELVIFDDFGYARDLSGTVFSCTPDKDIVQIQPRPGNDTFADGSGVLLVPTREGVATVSCFVDGVATRDTYKVIVSPQNLIQILVAEAGGQLFDEGDKQDGRVKLTSESPTGDAVAAVIRNRTKLIEEEDNPSLFNANYDLFYEDPDASYYDAVIMAPGQFSPTSDLDINYLIFTAAEDRNFLDEDRHDAYDQAVLTAAGIFSEETKDPTNGAFAFRSPSAEEWVLIDDALKTEAAALPDGCGVRDSDYPALAPVQILILNSTWKYEDGRPAFIFVRKMPGVEPAVISLP